MQIFADSKTHNYHTAVFASKTALIFRFNFVTDLEIFFSTNDLGLL